MKFIPREQLAVWLDELASDTTLVAPRQVEDVILYRPVRSSAEIAWDFTRPVLSVKGVFFPETERLFTIEKSGADVLLKDKNPIRLGKGGKPAVIFGVRPCDARGVSILDALFSGTEPADAYYTARRKTAVVVGLACREIGPACFCTSTGGAPDDPTHVDVMLSEVDGGYAVQVMTEKGGALLSWDSLPEYQGEISKPVSPELYPVPPQETWISQFREGFWESLAEGCISCRVCAYVCPTCRCFDVRDEAMPSQNGCLGDYERIRCWDSCAGEAYRRIAGGHNPRAAKGDRLRNRFYCKFYYYPRQYGLGENPACTGCGRCIELCPVNVDITEVLQRVAEVT